MHKNSRDCIFMLRSRSRSTLMDVANLYTLEAVLGYISISECAEFDFKNIC